MSFAAPAVDIGELGPEHWPAVARIYLRAGLILVGRQSTRTSSRIMPS
jgi:hypothetical protein